MRSQSITFPGLNWEEASILMCLLQIDPKFSSRVRISCNFISFNISIVLCISLNGNSFLKLLSYKQNKLKKKSFVKLYNYIQLGLSGLAKYCCCIYIDASQIYLLGDRRVSFLCVVYIATHSNIPWVFIYHKLSPHFWIIGGGGIEVFFFFWSKTQKAYYWLITVIFNFSKQYYLPMK